MLKAVARERSVKSSRLKNGLAGVLVVLEMWILAVAL
jgi:hypothetical protein